VAVTEGVGSPVVTKGRLMRCTVDHRTRALDLVRIPQKAITPAARFASTCEGHFHGAKVPVSVLAKHGPVLIKPLL
jgi:hypothetical protein